ncbi:lysozyme c-1-like isoform X2 [Sabethes cyaneus]|uniref:lysozyme c-1-like isoform X2 n=1 Tax=Sabethes cyaneus TaxID=53552 RepID=UPI00237EBC6A|nr:lysozyme c-1-like isoform X2 [Sabethes cyaneus]
MISRRAGISRGCFLLSILLITGNLANAKVFQKCPLARLLDSQQISRTLISNWICLVNAESGGDTSKKVSHDNLSASYGIFQINSKEWCRVGRKGGKCNKNCEAFLTDDISDDIDCAKLIYKDVGFSYWKGWVSKCKQKPLPDISHCWN